MCRQKYSILGITQLSALSDIRGSGIKHNLLDKSTPNGPLKGLVRVPANDIAGVDGQIFGQLPYIFQIGFCSGFLYLQSDFLVDDKINFPARLQLKIGDVTEMQQLIKHF